MIRFILLLISMIAMLIRPATAQRFNPSDMDTILYGVAYYYEYMPYERLEEDAAMMEECGINVVRICESTWATMEPDDGVVRPSPLG